MRLSQFQLSFQGNKQPLHSAFLSVTYHMCDFDQVIESLDSSIFFSTKQGIT